MATQQQQAAATIIERGLLKTAVPARDLAVVSAVQALGTARPWTAVFAGHGQRTRTVWLRFYDGPTSPGGLAEAHQAVVQQVQAGTLPQEDER